MTRKIRFVRDVFADGAKVHAVGDVHNQAPELAKHLRRGNAVEVEIADPMTEVKAGGKARGKK
jgi:hypothetical protein